VAISAVKGFSIYGQTWCWRAWPTISSRRQKRIFDKMLAMTLHFTPSAISTEFSPQPFTHIGERRA